MKNENESLSDLNILPGSWLDVLLCTKALPAPKNLQVKKMPELLETSMFMQPQLAGESLE